MNNSYLLFSYLEDDIATVCVFKMPLNPYHFRHHLTRYCCVTNKCFCCFALRLFPIFWAVADEISEKCIPSDDN